VGEQIRVFPGIAVGSGSRIIRISPITFSPITGYVADAGMRYDGGKYVGFSLQVLSHVSSVRSADASDSFFIYKRVFFAELLGSFDNVFGRTLSPRIDVASGKLLSETDSPARLDDIYHIVA